MSQCLKEIFTDAARKLHLGIERGVISPADTLTFIDIVYTAGILDESAFTAEQKKQMMETIKELCPEMLGTTQ